MLLRKTTLLTGILGGEGEEEKEEGREDKVEEGLFWGRDAVVMADFWAPTTTFLAVVTLPLLLLLMLLLLLLAAPSPASNPALSPLRINNGSLIGAGPLNE